MTEKNNEESASLFHYTTGAGLHGILESNCLWATHYRHLNDAHEGETGWKFFEEKVFFPILHQYFEPGWHQEKLTPEIILEIQNNIQPDEPIDNLYGFCKHQTKKHIKDRKKAYNYHFKGPFILSFCNSPEIESERVNGLLSMWRGYANGGYCVELEKEPLISRFQRNPDDYHTFGVYGDVIYNPEFKLCENDYASFKDSIVSIFTSIHNDNNIENSKEVERKISKDAYIFFDHLSRLKHSAFREECEFRIAAWTPTRPEAFPNTRNHYKIHHREQNGRLIPYIKLFEGCGQLPIKRIIVGPHPEAERRKDALEEILYDRRYNGEPIKVDVSEIPFIG